jgi:hydroxymethylpyrimidine pyrophosphatase-like HAD family hydrolase
MIEAVASDLDGTVLLPSPYEDWRDVPPTPRVLDARNRLRDAEIPVIAVTSRGPAQMQSDAIDELGLTDPWVLEGGARVRDPISGDDIESHVLESERVREIVRRIGPLCREVYCDSSGRPRTGDAMADDIIEPAASVFAVFGARNQEEIQQRLAALDELYPRFDGIGNDPRLRCVQVTDKKATKAQALLRLLARMDIDPHDVAGFGDASGDDFLNVVGLPVVMGNASLDMLTLPRRRIVPAVRNDGFAIGIERHVFGEEGPIIRKRHPAWRDGPRPPMSEQVRDSVLYRLARGESLVDGAALTELVQTFTRPAPLDPWQTTVAFAKCFGDSHELLTSDLDLLRPALGIEHNSGVQGVFEANYAPLLYHDPDALLTMRFYLQNQDIGKSLSVAVAGDSYDQDRFNPMVINGVVQALEGEGMADIQTAVRLLSGQDFIGQILKAKPDEVAQLIRDIQAGPLKELRDAWPQGFNVPLEDFLVFAYLSDAGAHTAYAPQMNATTGEMEWAVRPEDAQLTDLFVESPGGMLRLRPDLAQRVLALLPGVSYAREVLDPSEQDPMENLSAEFRDVVYNLFRREAAYATELEDGSQSIAMQPDTRNEAPRDLAWADRITVYNSRTNERPAKPPRISLPYIIARGVDGDGNRIFTHFYTRGGRIWRLDNTIAPAGRPSRPRILSELPDMGYLQGAHGARVFAAASARIEYGRPLSDAEAEELNIWFGASDTRIDLNL